MCLGSCPRLLLLLELHTRSHNHTSRDKLIRRMHRYVPGRHTNTCLPLHLQRRTCCSNPALVACALSAACCAISLACRSSFNWHITVAQQYTRDYLSMTL